MIKKLKSNDGFMGPTHALSAVAIALLLTWAASDFMFGKVLGTSDANVYIAALLIITGAALMPDLDAVRSTSISTLGFIGVGLSKAMRAFSKLVQATVRSKYDDVNADPHRGFWHTAVSAFLAGLLFTSLASIDVRLFTIKGKDISIATFTVLFMLFLSTQLILASLLKPFNNKMKRKGLYGKLITVGGGVLVAATLTMSLPDISYSWIGGAVTLGWMLHILGDMFTVAGVPVLWPIKIRGKRWWKLRMPFGIKAGGVIENYIIVPILLLITLISIVKIFPMII